MDSSKQVGDLGILNFQEDFIPKKWPEDVAVCEKSQVHDMFSRIFQITNLLIFSTKCHLIFFSLFSQMPKTEKKSLLAFFFNWEILGEKFRRFVFGKFVKTCRDLDKRPSWSLQHVWSHQSVLWAIPRKSSSSYL